MKFYISFFFSPLPIRRINSLYYLNLFSILLEYIFYIKSHTFYILPKKLIVSRVLTHAVKSETTSTNTIKGTFQLRLDFKFNF